MKVTPEKSVETGKPNISTEVFAVLTSLFATILAPTLDILDHGKVTKFRCAESGRCFYRVKEPDIQSYQDGENLSVRRSSS
jgi:hypothetical protein